MGQFTIRAALASVAILLATHANAKEIVRFLHNETDPPSIQFFNKAIETFEKQNPDIEIRMEAVSTDARLQKVLAAISAKTMPEVFKILPEELFQFSQRGYIEDLDKLVDDIGRDDFADGSLTFVNGKLFDVPYTIGNFSQLFYRKDLLAAKNIPVPKTWDDLEKAAAALTGDGTYGFVFPAAKTRMTSIFLSSLIWSAGGTYFDKDLNVTFDNPGTVKALTFLKKMAKYCPPGIASYSYNEMINAYLTGTVALDIYAGRLPANVAEQRPDLFAKTEVAPLPAGPSGVAVKYVSADSFAIATPKVGAENQDAARKFLKFLVTGDRVKDFALTAFPHLIPPLKSEQPIVMKAGLEKMNGRPEFAKTAFNTSNSLDFDTEAGAVIKDGKVVMSGVINPYVGAIIARNIPAVVVQRVVLQGEDPAKAAAWGADQMKRIVADLKKNEQ